MLRDDAIGDTDPGPVEVPPIVQPGLVGDQLCCGVVDLLVSACLCWVLVKIPGWVSRVVFSGSKGRGGIGRVVRDVIIYKGAKALAAGVGL